MPNARTTVWLALLWMLGDAGWAAADEFRDLATSEVRTKKSVLRRLGAGDSQVHYGQNIGHANGDLDRGYSENILGRDRGRLPPMLLGVDFGYDDIPAEQRATIRLLQKHWQGGGLVTASMHPANPWRASDCHDLKVGDFRQLVTPGTAAHDRLLVDLDRVADALEQLRDQGVVVLWRPWHEMNGGWFWWCPKQNGKWLSVDDYRLLWEYTYRYFTVERELDNLLWVYSAAVQYGKDEQSAVHYFPGDSLVDVVGLDWYTDKLDAEAKKSYEQLVTLGKPFGFTEFGPAKRRDGRFDVTRLPQVIQDHYPKSRFILFWHNWPGAKMSLIEQQGAN